jgi:hypothetical protein
MKKRSENKKAGTPKGIPAILRKSKPDAQKEGL